MQIQPSNESQTIDISRHLKRTPKMASLDNVPVVGDVLKKVENTGENIMASITEDVTAALGDLSITSGDSASTQTSELTTSVQPILATEGTTDEFFSAAMEVGVGEDNIQKLVLLGTANYTTQTLVGQVAAVIEVPRAFISSQDLPAYGQSQYFRFLRSGFRFTLMANASRGTAGGLLMVYLPPGSRRLTTGQIRTYDYTTMPVAPSVIMDISKSCEVHLAVPYVNYSSYWDYTRNTSLGGQLVVMALVQLIPAQGSGNSLAIAVYGEMIDADFQCPRPFGAQGRKKRKPLPPPPPAHVTNKVTIRPAPGAAVLSNSVLINDTDTLALAGDASSVDFVTAGAVASIETFKQVVRRWSILNYGGQNPYVTWQTNSTHGTSIVRIPLDPRHLGHIGILMDKYQFWRGSLEFRVIFFCSAFNQGRFQLSWFPGINPPEASYSQARNSLYVVSDVNGGPAFLRVPFVNANWRKRTTEQNGALQLYVVNPLVSNNAGQNVVRGIIMVRGGPDFELYSPQDGVWTITSQGGPEQIEEPEEVVFLNFKTPKVNIQTESHMVLKHYFGRSIYFVTINHQPHIQEQELRPPSEGPLALLRFFAYWTGEINLTISNKGTTVAYVAHTYTDGQPNTFRSLTALGALAIPPGEVKNISVPFYSETPLRSIWVGQTFGFLKTSTGGGQLEVYFSLRNPSFFYIMPFPSHTTPENRNVVESDHFIPPLGWPIEAQNPDTNEARLMQSGDVESNPGPVISLVKKNRGVYSHYGVKTDEKVFAMDTENPLKSFLKGHVNITCVEDDGSWEVVDTREVDFDLALSILTANKEHYSIDWNCESWAKELCQIEDETQGDRIKKALYVMMVLNGAFIVTQSSDLLSKFVKLLSDRVFASLENEIIKLVLRTIVRIVCYLILYAHAPNLLTTGALAVLLALDVTGNSIDKKLMGMIQGLIDGDFNKFCGDLLEHVDCDKKDLKKTIPKFAPPVTQQPKGMGCCPISCCTFVGQSPKDFNEWSNVGKNIKWWIEQVLMVINWLKDKLFSNNVVKATDWLEENVTMVALTIARTDQFLMDYHQDKSTCFKPEAKEVCGKLLDALSGISFALSQANDRSTLLPRVNSLIAKLESLRFDAMQQWKFRMEPYGIWVSGAPGVGKSFFSHYIAQAIAKKYGWTIYSNPSGSEHMDGYLNQEIHLFDDLGQIRDENDLKLICNLISSIPFIVPKADLESKGTYYNGKLVIATTNKGDFSSVVLADPEALKRRFPATYQIRPRPHYELNGKLNVAMANQTGDLATGNMWQTWIGGQWVDLDMGRLIDGLCKNIDSRLKIANIVGQDGEGKRREFKTLDDLNGLLDEMQENFDDLVLRIDSIQEQTRMFNDTKETKSIAQKIKTKFVEWINKTKDFCERNKAWFLIAGALGTISSLCFLAWEVYERYKENRPSEGESAYNGVFRPAKKVFVNKLTKVKGQSPQFEHILNRMAIVQTKSGPATALAFAGKSLITYGHGQVEKLTHFRDTEMDIKLKSVHMLADGEPQDLQILTPENQKELPYQFKDLSPLIHNEDYCGDGVLIWKTTSGYHFKDVKQIHPIGQLTTEDNITTTYNYAYFVQNHFGMCGGVLVGMVNGNPKILGIHMAGNGTLAVAARLYPTFTQGYVANKEKMPKPLYHLNTKSKFRGSPLQHVLDGDEEPAVLSKFDPRLKNPVDDVVKSAAAKYRGNRFTVPDDIFREAKRLVQQRIFSVVGNCRPLTYEEACNTEIMPIDWSTSPGHKYAGRTKHELIDDEDFKQDVAQCLENPKTIFVTHLKDELRSKEKVEIGKTRAIEAASFDYVMATRMRCGDFFRKIYQDRYCRSGLAVGINPYTDFCCLWDQLEEWNICLDYSAFDGSLSPELMEAAAEIIAYCYDEPEKVKAMIRPTIYSTNWVSDEVWTVEGGMCSGSPFTTILNSICGLLVAQTIYLHYGFDGVTFVYGDDAIWSVDKKVPIDDLAELVYDNFGMYVTSAEKTDNIQYIMKEEVTFLKRRFVQWRSMITGALFPQNIRSHLRWCKSPDTFSDQLYMACIEMALNGKSEYMKFYEEVKPHYPIMTWEQVVSVVDSLVMT